MPSTGTPSHDTPSLGTTLSLDVFSGKSLLHLLGLLGSILMLASISVDAVGSGLVGFLFQYQRCSLILAFLVGELNCFFPFVEKSNRISYTGSGKTRVYINVV